MPTTVSENTKPRKGVAAALAPVAPEPLLVRISEACRVSGFSRSDLYRRAARGEIEFRKAGKATLVVYSTLKEAALNLPTATITTQS